MSDKVRVVEVGPRDGLQNEPSHASTAVKVELIGRLFAAGLRSVEAGAFVSPKWVPQMADTADVLAALVPPADAELMALVPNDKGLAPALAGGITTVAVFVAASETFSRRNTNCSIAESLQRIVPVVEGSHAAGRRVRGYVSCIVGCPYEGAILPGAVAGVVEGWWPPAATRFRSATPSASPARRRSTRYSMPCCRALRPSASPSMPTTPTAWESRTCCAASSVVCAASMRPSPVSAAAPMRPAPAAMSPPKTSPICSRASACRRASTSTD